MISTLSQYSEQQLRAMAPQFAIQFIMQERGRVSYDPNGAYGNTTLEYHQRMVDQQARAHQQEVDQQHQGQQANDRQVNEQLPPALVEQYQAAVLSLQEAQAAQQLARQRLQAHDQARPPELNAREGWRRERRELEDEIADLALDIQQRQAAVEQANGQIRTERRRLHQQAIQQTTARGHALKQQWERVIAERQAALDQARRQSHEELSAIDREIARLQQGLLG